MNLLGLEMEDGGFKARKERSCITRGMHLRPWLRIHVTLVAIAKTWERALDIRHVSWYMNLAIEGALPTS